MEKLNDKQQSVFNRVAAKAESMGLIRADQGWYWAHSYRLGDNDKLTLGCNCDPNIVNSPVHIIVMILLPSTGKYAKYETKTYSIEEFEKLNASNLIELSNYVQAKNAEVEELEAKLNFLRKDLTKYAKKALKLL